MASQISDLLRQKRERAKICLTKCLGVIPSRQARNMLWLASTAPEAANSRV